MVDENHDNASATLAERTDAGVDTPEPRAQLEHTEIAAEPQVEPRDESREEPPEELRKEPRVEPQEEPREESRKEPQVEPREEPREELLEESRDESREEPFVGYPSTLEIGSSSDEQSIRDDDSALGASLVNSTVSLRSSIYAFEEENGRTYHAYNSGKYMLPNDEREQDRLDLQHHTFKIICNGQLHLAPIDHPQRVLDLATGTGIWAIEFADQYPESRVIGTDLSPIQPDYIPANCEFQVDDAENDWTFFEPFNYIHARAMVTCFKDNRAICQKIFDNLAPGGYFELQDPCFPVGCDDGTLKGTSLGEWSDTLVSAMASIGRDITASHQWASHMRAVGFEDVEERRFYVPTNTWARGKKNKLLGTLCTQNLSEGVASMSTAAFTRILGWTREKLEVFLVGVRNDLVDKNIHAYIVVYFAWGRKPAVAVEGS